MAERKPPQHKVSEAEKEVKKMEKEEAQPSLLANPKQPMEPSPGRHWAYAGVIIFGGLILNIVLIVLLAGAAGG
jgi:hypothetical protein